MYISVCGFVAGWDNAIVSIWLEKVHNFEEKQLNRGRGTWEGALNLVIVHLYDTVLALNKSSDLFIILCISTLYMNLLCKACHSSIIVSSGLEAAEAILAKALIPIRNTT